MPDLRAPEWTPGRMDDLRKSLRAAHEGSSLVPMAILSPSPPLCLSRTLPPPASLSSPLHTHTHPLQQWTEPPADSHGVTLFKSTQPSLPASSAGRPRSSRVLHFGYTLLLLFYTQTDTHTRTDAQADIFCLIMTAEMRRSSSTIAVSVK